MKNKQPLLSVCIPTFNRADFLDKALNSYVHNPFFSEDVEIVISDNASTDDTEQIGQKYANEFPNIRYFKNETNIKDQNFPLALDRAQGKYIKLMNDNLIINELSLCYILDTIKENLNNKTPLFFINRSAFPFSQEDKILCNSMGDFVERLSYLVTAIHCFGAWKEDWEKIKNRTKYSELKLNQDDWCYQILVLRGSAILCTKRYFTSLFIGNRSGYNWFEVHVDNYYKILEPYCKNGMIDKKSIQKEKKVYLSNLWNELVLCYFFNFRPDWQFDMKGTFKIMWKNYHEVPFFYLTWIILPFWALYLFYYYRIKPR